MSLSNCYACGKLYLQERISANFCADCTLQYENKFQMIKNLLRDNPRMTVQEIVEKSGLPSKLIMDWVREGRIHSS